MHVLIMKLAHRLVYTKLMYFSRTPFPNGSVAGAAVRQWRIGWSVRVID